MGWLFLHSKWRGSSNNMVFSISPAPITAMLGAKIGVEEAGTGVFHADLSHLQSCQCLFSLKLIAGSGHYRSYLPVRGTSGALSISSLRSAYFICLLPMESSASGFLRWKENVLFFLALHISPDIFVPFHCFLINRPILASDPFQNVLLATRHSLICSTIALVRTEIGSLAPALCSADARAIYIIPWVFWVQIHMQAPIGSIFSVAE